MKLLGYCRVSTKDQVEKGVSLAVQREKLDLYCRLHNHELVEVIADEGKSAKSLLRPGLMRARGLLLGMHPAAEGLLVCDLDRLTRSVRDLATLLDEGMGKKYALHTVTGGVDTTTAAGELVLNVLTSVAQWQRKNLAEDITEALAHVRATGKHLGPAPFGYRRAWCGKCGRNGVKRCDGCGRLEPVTEEQAVIAAMMSMRLEGVGYEDIANSANEAGARGRRGGAWSAMSVRRVLMFEEDLAGGRRGLTTSPGPDEGARPGKPSA